MEQNGIPHGETDKEDRMPELTTARPAPPAASADGPSGDGPSVVWFRDDLRLSDNPALHAAIERGRPVVAVYVLDEQSPGIRPLGGAAR